MEQEIRFCTTSDGVRIAYATVGDGPPVVYACGWPTHLELEWERPFARSFLEALAEGSTLIRYDMRGAGLSDPDVSDFSLDSLTKDLAAVVDHLALERFALLGLGSLAGPIAMTYAAEHRQRVTRLVLSTAFVRGAEIAPPDRQQAVIDFVAQFGVPLFGIIDQPQVDIEAQRSVQQLQDTAASPKMQAALMRTEYAADVSGLLDHLTMPTLVLHGREDRTVPFALGRDLAARLPHARFVPFEGVSNPPWTQTGVIVPEIRRFLGIEADIKRTPLSGLVTILFTDVEGSTALTQRLGDAKSREVLREHERIVREALKAHGGSEVKTTGDGFMTSFSSAMRALECAIAMQRAFAKHNESAAEPILVRVGLNAGEPIAEDEDLFGAAVIMAARIAGEAQGGEILASDVVRQLVAGKEFLFADRGEVALRGFDEPVRLYEVRWQA